MSISEDHINTIISKVASQCDLTEWKYTQEKFETIAQNYFGVLIPIVLYGTNKDEDIRKIPLVLKLAPADERFRVTGALTIMFCKEVYVYSTILSNYSELLHSLRHCQYVIPRCYFASQEYCREVVVLQDMREDGYKPYTNSFFLDYDHITISVKALGVFHALSFVLREQKHEVYKDIVQQCVPLSAKTNKRFLEILRDRLNKALDKFEGTKYTALFENFREKLTAYVESTANAVQEVCICHGDIWKENILFKYKDGKVGSACVIDYQTARMSSPAYDVLYLIAVSTHTALRQKYLHELLVIYHNTFKETLSKAGLEALEIYSWDSFRLDLKKVAPACVIIANTALWLCNGLQEEGHVRSKLVWTTEEEKARAVANYKSTVQNLIDDFYSHDYLSLCPCL